MLLIWLLLPSFCYRISEQRLLKCWKLSAPCMWPGKRTRAALWKWEWLILFMLFDVISNKKAVKFRFGVFFPPPCETKALTYLVYLALFFLPPHLQSELWCLLPDPQSWVLCPEWAGRAGSPGLKSTTRPSRLCCSTVLLRNGSWSRWEMARQKERRKRRIDLIFMQLHSLAHTGGSVSINGNF